MKKVFLFFALLHSSFSLAIAQSAPTRTEPVQIIIKADDLRGMHPNWQRFVDIIEKRHIKASIGIICDSLENPKPEYVQWIRNIQAKGLIEFWCHGYDHKQWTENGLSLREFAGTSYEHQKQHLSQSVELARQKLGFAFQSFGAPFNATDAVTARVLVEEPDIKVVLYGDKKQAAGKIILDRIPEVNIENPLFIPNPEKLAAGFQAHPERPYFVIQGHPPQWIDAGFSNFEKILDFLTEQGCGFATPSEFANAPQSNPSR